MDESFQKTNAFSEMMLKMAETSWDGYLHFQEQWLGLWTGANTKPSERNEIQNPAQDIFKIWIDFYEREFKRFLTTPQLGLARFHQERMREVLDKFNLFQIKMAEFIYFLLLPMEQSFKGAQERLKELTEDGNPSGNPKEYYQIWVKVLEEYYVRLFRSPSYTQAMNGTLDALEEFTLARKNFLESFLQMIQVPSYTDLDDLSKDVYELKKRVKELEGGKDDE